MTDLVVTGIAKAGADVEDACVEVAENEGEISQALTEKLEAASLVLKDRVDYWQSRIDAAKGRVEVLKEMKDRITKAIKAADNVQSWQKSFIKGVLTAFPNITFRGSTGAFYLHKNPESVNVDFTTVDKTIYKVIDKVMVNLEPGLNPYVKEIKLYVLETDKIKADLKSGMVIPWARLEQDSHVRTKA